MDEVEAVQLLLQSAGLTTRYTETITLEGKLSYPPMQTAQCSAETPPDHKEAAISIAAGLGYLPRQGPLRQENGEGLRRQGSQRHRPGNGLGYRQKRFMDIDGWITMRGRQYPSNSKDTRFTRRATVLPRDHV